VATDVKRGYVYLVSLDPTTGSEIRKTRPCVVVSPDELNTHMRTCIVAPMTTAGVVKLPKFLTTNWLLTQFDRDPAEAVRGYREFVKQGKGVDVWKDVSAGVLLGNEPFVQSLRPLLRDLKENRKIGSDPRLNTRPSLKKLFSGIKDKPTRNERIHAAIRTHQYTLQEVADHLGLCYSTISVIAKRIEQNAQP